ncbi:MAG: hypothetical protein FJ011_15785, partial [Chloroflexi bacterium]|nr:hypothetical protein [Chloroflexota bacterium]
MAGLRPSHLVPCHSGHGQETGPSSEKVATAGTVRRPARAARRSPQRARSGDRPEQREGPTAGTVRRPARAARRSPQRARSGDRPEQREGLLTASASWRELFIRRLTGGANLPRAAGCGYNARPEEHTD